MRVLSVENPKDIYKRVWLDDKEVTNQTWQAEVPDIPGVTGLGWVDRYETDDQGYIVFVEEVNGPRSYRSHGLVRWAERASA